jgi:hypothetical protein
MITRRWVKPDAILRRLTGESCRLAITPTALRRHRSCLQKKGAATPSPRPLPLPKAKIGGNSFPIRGPIRAADATSTSSRPDQGRHCLNFRRIPRPVGLPGEPVRRGELLSKLFQI